MLSDAVPVMTHIAAPLLVKLWAADLGHGLLYEVDGYLAVRQGDGKHVSKDSFHAAFVLTSPEDTLDDVRAALYTYPVCTKVGMLCKVCCHGGEEVLCLLG